MNVHQKARDYLLLAIQGQMTEDHHRETRLIIADLQCEINHLAKEEKKRDWADEIGKPAYEAILDMVMSLKDQAGAIDAIVNHPLSVRIFGEYSDGEWTADKFEILISTGGPAVRIMGELENDEPYRAWLEVQNWGKPWTRYFDTIQSVLLDYCKCFCFEVR